MKGKKVPCVHSLLSLALKAGRTVNIAARHCAAARAAGAGVCFVDAPAAAPQVVAAAHDRAAVEAHGGEGRPGKAVSWLAACCDALGGRRGEQQAVSSACTHRDPHSGCG